jgi:hypothetical protein
MHCFSLVQRSTNSGTNSVYSKIMFLMNVLYFHVEGRDKYHTLFKPLDRMKHKTYHGRIRILANVMLKFCADGHTFEPYSSNNRHCMLCKYVDVVIIIIIICDVLKINYSGEECMISMHVSSTLKLPGINSKFRTFAIFIFIKLRHKIRRYVYAQSSYKLSNSDGSLVISIKQKAKYTFRAAAILFYIMLRNSYLTKYTYSLIFITM